MNGHILTEVSAHVAPEHESDLLAAYQHVIDQPLPDGLLRTELLHGADGRWRIQTLWRDQAAIDAMRASPGGPAAPRVFRAAAAEPELAIFEVALRRLPTDPQSRP